VSSTDRFVRFGFFAGAAFRSKTIFQPHRDPVKYGKELNGDIQEGSAP
jgi:hypothetical protein